MRLEVSESLLAVQSTVQQLRPNHAVCARVYAWNGTSLILLDQTSGCTFLSLTPASTLLARIAADDAGPWSFYVLTDVVSVSTFAITDTVVTPGRITQGVQRLRSGVRLAVQGDPTPGGSITWTVGGAPGLPFGTPAGILFSVGLGSDPLLPSSALDLTRLIGSVEVLIGIPGVTLQLPSDPALSGLRLFAQAYAVSPTALDPVTFSDVIQIDVR